MEFQYTKKQAYEVAKQYANKSFLCSEAVLLALSEAQNVKSSIIPKIATGFGAGLARCGELCGALSGAIMGLGLAYGRDTSVETSYSPYWFSKEMVKAFKKEFGSIRCPDLLGLDLENEKDIAKYRKDNMWENICEPIITKTVVLSYDLLEKNSKLEKDICGKTNK
jgi:C_GCAxxG_C_C family probable redox protein